MPYNNKLFLASASPRRRFLVGQVFENNNILSYSCEEPKWQKGENLRLFLNRCLDAKWQAGLLALRGQKLTKGQGLLVADTLVALGREVLEKPEDSVDARRMLRMLSGSKHFVYTAFRLGKYLGEEQWEEKLVISRSEVLFRALSAKEIEDYVASKEPLDKAGAYGFQGKGIQLVKSVKGPYTNIVGLPLKELHHAAEQLRFR